MAPRLAGRLRDIEYTNIHTALVKQAGVCVVVIGERWRGQNNACPAGDLVVFLAAARKTIMTEGRSVIGADDAHLLDSSRPRCSTSWNWMGRSGSLRPFAPRKRCPTRSRCCCRTAIWIGCT